MSMLMCAVSDDEVSQEIQTVHEHEAKLSFSIAGHGLSAAIRENTTKHRSVQLAEK